MKYLSLALLIILLCSCGQDGVYEVVDSNDFGGRVKIYCAPDRVEVGLRVAANPIPFTQSDGAPTASLPFWSEVTVFDEKGGLISKTTSNQVAVAWQAADKFRHIEYFGLQEIDMPFRFGCADYLLEIRHRELPRWLISNQPVPPEIYARKSKRP